jgi:lysophospholipase L1-like esterase
MEPYESFDGLHPNAKGMRQISAAVLSAWKKG